MDKSAFRKAMLELRGNIPESIRENKSRIITEKIITSKAYAKSHKVLCFISMGSEPDTVALINASISSGKITACPRVKPGTREMVFYEIHSFEGLIKSKFGAYEPPEDSFKRIQPDNETLIIVPALAFDRDGYRIGYGGGYYDTYIDNNPLGYKLGIAFSEMVMETVPKFPHDKRTDALITDSSVYTWQDYEINDN